MRIYTMACREISDFKISSIDPDQTPRSDLD